MMGRPDIRATLGLLLALVLIHISIGERNAIEKEIQANGIQTSSIEYLEHRVARDARMGRKGKHEDNKEAKKGRKQPGKSNKNIRKNKKNIGQNRKNRMKKRKEKKQSKKQLRKNMKTIKRKNQEKKSRKKKNKPKKGERKSGRTKMKAAQKKKSQQNKKESRTSRKMSIQQKLKKNAFSKSGDKQACDEKALCQKIKDYVKISNQLRKVRRIKKSCDTMDKKAKKSVSEFEATVTALETAIGSSSRKKIYRFRWRRAVDSSNDVTSIKEKLKNCSSSAKEKCLKSAVAPCQEEANLTKCETELQGWLNSFGPAKGSCLQASADCCACITALPDVSSDCLGFDAKSTVAVASRKKCTSGDEEGSFGFCRKLQVEAAEKGPKHAKENCQSDLMDSMTTKGPGKCPSNWLQCNNPGSSPCKQSHLNHTGYCCKKSNKDCCAPNKEACTKGTTDCKIEGCFKDQVTPKLFPNLISLPSNNSLSNCKAECLSKYPESHYYGVENGNDCFCGTKPPCPPTLAHPQVDDSLCEQFDCPGDTSTKCGGSVYIKVRKIG